MTSLSPEVLCSTFDSTGERLDVVHHLGRGNRNREARHRTRRIL